MSKKYTIIDAHQDLAFNALNITGKDFFVRSSFDKSHLLSGQRLNQSDYVRMVEAGYKVVFGVVFPLVFQNEQIKHDQDLCRHEALEQLAYYKSLEEEGVRILRTQSDLQYVMDSEDVLGIFILMEDAIAIDPELNNLQEFYDMGLRAIGPVWNWDNHFGGGTDTDNGLTEAGKNLLSKMTELGMALDTAHMNPVIFDESLREFSGSIFNSHTGAYSLNPHRRNLRNSQLQTLADRGGVIGVPFVPEFLHPDQNQANIQDVIAHIQHIISTVGTDHVALGSDFDGMSWPNYLPQLKDVADVPLLLSHLEKLYQPLDIKKISHTNWLTWLNKVLF